ncbi:MAG: amidohydrolase family protein [Bacteroidota bacterium]|nr:MAG: amidohydrolase family protein [Bacteroidota bacterium]
MKIKTSKKLFFLWLVVCSISMADVLAQNSKEVEEPSSYLFHDAHFHLTNYIQEGISMQFYVDSIMGDKVGRSTVFGLPLQQQWSYRVTGENAPTYYLDTDAPLYYYSFCDAHIAMEYLSLPKEKQERLDPMIIGFNVTDMYAVDHIKRVLKTFPGVFTGIGEFSIHKEFVSAKVSGDVASLTDPALDRIFEFCAESGLIAIVHNDIDNPFPKPGKPNYLHGMQDLIKKHPNSTIIWAHVGVGRIVAPLKDMLTPFEAMLSDSAYNNLYIDISWDETAKYIVESEKSLENASYLINKYPDRFLFGTDNVAPTSQEKNLGVYQIYEPLWKLLTPEAREKILFKNYERLFDKARADVRAWEKANLN